MEETEYGNDSTVRSLGKQQYESIDEKMSCEVLSGSRHLDFRGSSGSESKTDLTGFLGTECGVL